MMSRRHVLAGVAGVALAGGGYAAGMYRAAIASSRERLSRQSSVISVASGTLEYAVAGTGAPVMMIHGTGGGFDQGLLFASGLRERGFQIIAPSRFGYLRSTFADDPSPAHQADVLVELLDHLGVERIAVAGGSAGALTAAEFALRHPERCSHLILLVPAANLTQRDPVAFSPVQRMAVDLVLDSNFWFWALCALAPSQMIRTLLATDPALLTQVNQLERQRAEMILSQLLPISDKVRGLRNDGYWAGTPSPTGYEKITVPTLLLSCADDLFGTAETARLLSGRISGARLTIYPSGGHIWLGHDDDVATEIANFIKPNT